MRKHWIGLDWIGLDWIGLDWIGLDWIGLDWIGDRITVNSKILLPGCKVWICKTQQKFSIPKIILTRNNHKIYLPYII